MSGRVKAMESTKAPFASFKGRTGVCFEERMTDGDPVCAGDVAASRVDADTHAHTQQ